jgi:iron complex transport system ATP-binding protein
MSLVIADQLGLPGRLSPTSLTLESGTITCLVGPNGSGKTSLLHALAGIGGAQGNVQVDDEDLARQPPRRRAQLLTYLPSTRDLVWPLRARDLVALGGGSQAEVEDAMAQLDLAALADRRTGRLSTGERSRVLIARAISTRPRLLLLDEPTANLDPLWQIKFMDLLAHEISGRGRAAIVAMHDLDAAAMHADRLIVMNKGSIAADGNPAELLVSPVMARVFGIERGPLGWRPAALRPLAGP